MFRCLYNLLYESRPASFKSDVSVNEAVALLSKAVQPNIINTLFLESAVGSVAHSRVSLYRHVPFVPNPFQWAFIGTFSEIDSTVLLCGRFRMRTYPKLFMTLWFAGVAGFVLFAIAMIALHRKPEAILALVVLLAMLGFVCAVIVFGKWLARHDIEWISTLITSSLTREAT